MDWRTKYGIDSFDENLINENKILKEKLEKTFLEPEIDKNLSTTTPDQKVLYDDNAFMSVNDVFFNDGTNSRKASDNIPLWRRMSTNSIYVRYAMEQIINEAIVCDGRKDPIKLDFIEGSKLKENTKKRINYEWEYLKNKVLKVKQNMHTHFKLWYSDGIIIFENIYNNDKMRDGIRKVKVIDPMGLTYGHRDFKNLKSNKVNKKKVWYYDKNSIVNSAVVGNGAGFANLFNPFDYSINDKEIYFEDEQISFATSDIFDSITGSYLSYLNFAVRPLNQLFAVENAFVVFALTRSTDKIVYYVDVGNLPEPKAKAKIQEIARDNSTTQKYDSSKGSIVDAPDKIKLTNEIYLARRNGTKGTEIDSLSASNVNLGDVAILTYLKDNLDTSLFMPRSRRNKDYKFNLGYAKEVDYEELAFYKMILKLRSLFTQSYIDILGKHLISKNIVTQREWEDEVQGDIIIVFNDNNDYERMKYIYDLQEKVAMIDQIFSYVKLPADANEKLDIFDIKNDILKKILQYSDAEIADWEKRMNEIKSAEVDNPENSNIENQNQDQENIETDSDADYTGYQTEDLIDIYKRQLNEEKPKLSGSIEFKDLQGFESFFEYLKENDEVVVKKDGKVTNLKWKISNGELVEV